MSDASMPFAFSQFVPGFDFLRNLASASASATAGPGVVPGMPSLSSWVAPTLSVEEVDKRIQELKTVQYWLEQNGHALKATIQALEVQKMTLSTLRGMNVRMEDLANAFTRAASPPPAPEAAAPAPEAEEQPSADAAAAPAEGRRARKSADTASADASGSPGVIDPLEWWGALTQQFQQIASSALQDAANLKMPPTEKPRPHATRKSNAGGADKEPAQAAPAPKARSKTAPAGRRAPAARKSAAPARKRARER